MKKISIFLTMAALFSSGCTFQMQVLTPAPAITETSTATPPVDTATSTSTPTAVPTLPSPTATPLGPQFFNARFTLDPNTARYQNIFPAKTKRIYAVWDYRNMRQGMVIRRDWYYNNSLWISREEPWDFGRYGASGTIRDISVYELDAGLVSGEYRLELYIDSQPQPIFGGVSWPTFTISPNEFRLQALSPDGAWTALVHDPARLSVIDPNGNVQEMYLGTEIVDLAWSPDSQHIFFLDRADLWILNVVNTERSLLYESATALGTQGGLMISPDGRTVATTEGFGNGDACFMDLQLLFVAIGGDYTNAGVILQSEFEGLPSLPDTNVYPVGAGVWQNSARFEVPLKVTCTPDESLAGQYVFDIPGRTAAKR